jgi:hypothetical protein
MAVQTIVVGDEAELSAALRAASGETIIKLKAGIYDRFTIDNINPTATVTITSFDLANKTEIDTLFVKNSSNLIFQDLYFHHFEPRQIVTGPQVRVSNSHDIKFIRDEFAGNVDSVNTNDASGIQVSDSTRISILDNNFHDLMFASFALRSNYLVIAGNEVSKVREGMDFSDVDYVSIDRNQFSDFVPLTTGIRPDHPDGIQFWTSGSTGSTNVAITNNAFLFSDGLPIQGIFIRSEQGDVARHSDFLIANNVYHGQSRHGITVYDADNVRITENTVVSAPKTGTAIFYDPAINTENTRNVEIDHNVTTMLLSSGGDIGRNVHDNIDVWDSKQKLGITQAELFGSAPTADALPDDFLVEAGSLADRIDAGFDHVDRIGNWASDTSVWVDKYHAMLDTAGSTYHIA